MKPIEPGCLVLVRHVCAHGLPATPFSERDRELIGRVLTVSGPGRSLTSIDMHGPRWWRCYGTEAHIAECILQRIDDGELSANDLALETVDEMFEDVCNVPVR